MTTLERIGLAAMLRDVEVELVRLGYDGRGPVHSICPHCHVTSGHGSAHSGDCNGLALLRDVRAVIAETAAGS